MLLLITLVICHPAHCQISTSTVDSNSNPIKKTIFIYGGGLDKVWLSYIISLTHKINPRICFIPTAAADNETTINYWYANCTDMPMRPYVLRSFIISSPEQKTFEETILDFDAIIVGGGNTLNMLAIWRAQGIDSVLRKAYDKGIVLAGGSAGSLCWFTGGYTDSRPKEMTLLKCLGFLNYSHSPHYNVEPERRLLYRQAVLDGKLRSGYACDDMAGILFINGEMAKSVSENLWNNNYFVSVKSKEIFEEKLPAEILK